MTTPSRARMTPTDAPEPTPDGFCVCNGPAANGRMRDCGIAAHRAEADAPEPTPGVERAARVLDPDAFALQSPANRKLFVPRAVARARKIVAAALATECHEAVVPDWTDGEEQPCNAYAVAYREDVVGDAVLGVYPVCEEHARPPLVPLTTAILGGVAL